MNINLSGGSVFGLDIGSSAVRAVQLKNSKSSSQLLHYSSTGIEQANDGTIKVLPDDEMIPLIKQSVKSAGITAKKVILGVPTSKTFSTVVDLPKMEKKSDQDKTIPVRAEEFIPMPIDGVDLDWRVLGDSPADQNLSEVLLVAVDKAYNQSRVDLVQKAGFEVIAVEPDAFALPRAVIPGDEHGKNHIIIETGNLETDLIILLDGKPRLIRTISTGMQQVIHSVSSSLSIDINQAQQYMFKFGLDKTKLEGQIFKAAEPAISQIISEIIKSTKFITGRYGQVDYEDILLSGTASYIPGLDQYVQESVKLPTIIGSSWTNVTYPEKLRKELMAINNNFAVVVGLGRRSDA